MKLINLLIQGEDELEALSNTIHLVRSRCTPDLMVNEGGKLFFEQIMFSVALPALYAPL